MATIVEKKFWNSSKREIVKNIKILQFLQFVCSQLRFWALLILVKFWSSEALLLHALFFSPKPQGISIWSQLNAWKLPNFENQDQISTHLSVSWKSKTSSPLPPYYSIEHRRICSTSHFDHFCMFLMPGDLQNHIGDQFWEISKFPIFSHFCDSQLRFWAPLILIKYWSSEALLLHALIIMPKLTGILLSRQLNI